MKKINFTALLLAIIVVSMFCLVGVSLFYENIFFISLFFILGFLFMGLGIFIKVKRGIQ